MLKRAFDLTVATVALVVLSPLLLAIALWVRLDSAGPVFHRGTRVGRAGRPFRIFKFRTMTVDGAGRGPAVTAADDPRITGAGAVLRRSKLDELPQLLNVLAGDMSIVGPRPEDPLYVELYSPDQRRLLEVRPGITSAATLAYRDEQSILEYDSAEDRYVREVLPAKLALDLQYLDSPSMLRDLAVVWRTAGALVGDLPMLGRLGQAIRRFVPWALIDAAIVVAGFYTAMLSRFLDGTPQTLRPMLADLNTFILPLIALYIAVNHALRLDQRVWRYARGPEAVVIFFSAGLATTIAFALDVAAGFLEHARPVPLSVLLIGGLLTACGEVAARYRSRLIVGLLRWSEGRRPGLKGRQRTIIYGAGDTGQMLAWRLVTHRDGRQYEVVGYVDDDPAKRGKRIHGIPVIGTGADLADIVAGQQIDIVMLAIAGASGEQLRHVVTRAQESPAQVRIIPGPEWMSTTASGPLVREVRVEDLLGRQPVQVDIGACEGVLTGRSVMVTGGCGSVGSELCRQIAPFRPARLVILDNNESGLFELDLELSGQFPDLPIRVVVGDVTDAIKLDMVFEHHQPTVIFHAAAYKHVPLMQEFPEEAVRVNVFGTRVVLEQARAHGAEHFVLVSTDKAVNPRSVMGATKRLAELLVMETAAAWNSEPAPLVCTAVRFGNVLGSRGSVVPVFARQIEMGGPVTVTHPDMTRYFMDVSEAAALIIQAASLTRGGDVFMLEMGERIRVDDLARKMIRFRGLRPEIDIPIVYSGIRPGEKLHEDLAYADEEKQATSHPLIYRFDNARHGSVRITDQLDLLAQLVLSASANDLIIEVMHLAGSPDSGGPLEGDEESLARISDLPALQLELGAEFGDEPAALLHRARQAGSKPASSA